MNTQTLRERRARTISEMRSLTSKAAQEDRDLSDEETRSFDSHKATLERLEKDLERAEYLASAERSMATDPKTRRGNDGSFGDLAGQVQISRIIAAQIDPRSTDCGRELEVSRELELRSGRKARGLLVPFRIERRDLTTSGTSSATVPNPLLSDRFVEPLRVAPRVIAAGATVLDGLVGDVDIPRQTATSSVSSVFEHGAVDEATPTFDQIQLRPKTIGAYVEISRRMLINSIPSVEQIVRRDLSNALDVEVDRLSLVGDPTGTSPNNAAPIGLVNVAGVNAVSFGGAPSWAKVLAMTAAVAVDNAEAGSLGFMGNSYVRRELLATLIASSTDSRHITEDPNALAGYPLWMSNHLAGNPTTSPVVAGQLVYGNWNDLILGFWSGVDIVVNPYHTDVFAKGGALISAFLDFDVDVRHAESFTVGTGMTLTAP